MENTCSHAPLGDKTNTTAKVDAKERKRERDRARWHAMSREQKDAINKRQRECYHQRKKLHGFGTTNYDDAASNKENGDQVDTNDWLHRNDSCQIHNIVDENVSTQLPCN